MKLGYIDRNNVKIIYYLPKKDKRLSLFRRENTTGYIKRFFSSIEGLGNIHIVKNKRIISSRGL